jgi:hypothetical protein
MIHVSRKPAARALYIWNGLTLPTFPFLNPSVLLIAQDEGRRIKELKIRY